MSGKYEKAQKMFFKYSCSTYGMRVDGVYEDYQKYEVPTALEISWKKEFVDISKKNLFEKKSLESLSVLAKEASGGDLSALSEIYKFYRQEKHTDDLLFLSKVCRALVNTFSFSVIRKCPEEIYKILKEVTITVENIIRKINSKNCCSVGCGSLDNDSIALILNEIQKNAVAIFKIIEQKLNM